MKTELNKKNGAVLWLTGLSGAGKSTIGNRLYDIFYTKGIPVERIDGDIFRNYFGNRLNFNKEDRDFNIKMAAFTSSLLEKHGIFVIASFISPYKHQRDFVRDSTKNFIEVYVNASIDTCIKRDTKGLYKKALSGEIENFTGISDPYEVPENPCLVADTDTDDLETLIKKINDYLLREKYL